LKSDSKLPALVMDGALGTELIRRGLNLPAPLWSAEANLKNGDLVAEIHRDYVSSGADIITTNTFRTTTWSYLKAGFTPRRARERARSSLEKAVEFALKAGQDKIVAGSLTSLEDCYEPQLFPGKSAAEDNYGETAEWFLAAGIKLLLFETMGHKDEIAAALEITSGLGIKRWLSLILKDEKHILSGAPLADLINSLKSEDLDMLLFNCNTIRITARALPVLHEHWPKAWGVYPNLGKTAVTGDGSSIDVIDDLVFKESIGDYLQLKPDVIGACCGSTPQQIGIIREIVDNFPN